MVSFSAGAYWIYRTLMAPQPIPQTSQSTWVPTTFTRLLELLKLRRVNELVFRGDAIFFKDNQGGAFSKYSAVCTLPAMLTFATVTGIVPGSTDWLFDQIK